MSVPTDVVIPGTASNLSCTRLTSDALPETEARDTIAKPSSKTGVSTQNTLSPTTPLTPYRSPLTVKNWFALRTTYSRERQAYDYITTHGGTAYLPTITEYKEVDGKRVAQQMSRIPNILFAYGTQQEIEQFVYDNHNLPYLRFYYAPERFNGTLVSRPLIVPDRQMESLRILCAIDDGNIAIVPQNDTHFHKGQEVLITQGRFAGITGRVARYQGQQRVAVIIPGLITIATAYIPTAFLTPIGND
ncbi:MAG: UpxY family transcription antiterminator [Bacteroidaceae bacterium]|nr:UpxY family transcription antiterminator [Bacteroidaceae bacterium]